MEKHRKFKHAILSPTFTLLTLSYFLSSYVIVAKVVVLFPIPHVSNVRTHTNVGRSLVSLGHTAYVCIPRYMLDQNQVNVDGVKVIPYGKYLKNFEKQVFGEVIEKFWRGENQGLRDYVSFFQTTHGVVKQILSDQNLMARLKGLKPDLFVITNSPPFRNFVVITHILGVAFVYLSPFNDLIGQRVPFSPSSTACFGYRGFNIHDMSFLDRLRTAVCNICLSIIDYYFMDDDLVVEFAPHKPKISVVELSLKAELFIIESDHILDFAKPELPNMKLIGSTAVLRPHPLEEPFRTFAEGSQNGIILATFGSSVVNIPSHVIDQMTSAFSQLDMNVVWKVNLTSPDPEKILTSLWVPQNDVLAHPKTRLVVSNCGNSIQYEALYNAIPMLCLPIFGEQFYNSRRSDLKNFGLTADIRRLSDKDFVKLIRKITTNDKYKNSIKKASQLFHQLYQLPPEAAAYWIDHVMEYGGKYMRSAGLDLPLYQLVGLDTMGFVAVVVVVVLVVLFVVLRCCWRGVRRCLWGKTKRKTD
ncbi:UDP-glucuronosyltransferase 1A1-like [Physella acuta]|uniref:UDP-glucuronosyltransferase 1A1-like n=1 Tax=Physella acuta TaxID=109671 RepID=UPI0027DC946D|nr:UDP-glucuronosyltransferase 1A1-like [Physella acuta]